MIDFSRLLDSLMCYESKSQCYFDIFNSFSQNRIAHIYIPALCFAFMNHQYLHITQFI